MKALILSSEVYPFAKTGGLGDVAGALPRALSRLGIEVGVVMPYYRKVAAGKPSVEVVSEAVPCGYGDADRPFTLLRGHLPGPEGVPVWFIRNEGIFEVDDAIYAESPGSYGDGHLRFVYFAMAALSVPAATGFFPDVFHLNDWQAALVAPLLRFPSGQDRRLAAAATVLTIHNLAYQGTFSEADLAHAGVPVGLLEEGRLLEGGGGNLLAGGIRYADAVSTVSRTYAREILTAAGGAGLDGLLRWRGALLRGIVNGLDQDAWDPARDKNLAATYDADRLDAKAENRGTLLDAFRLPPTRGPVFGVVSRLTSQKGLDLVPKAIRPILDANPHVRLAVLGSGDPDLEDAFRALADEYPAGVGARFKFDDALAHQVEAGADFFLMPSRFEPCGLNQLISMHYGTPPVVRRTGGLADTVVDANDEALARGDATGIVFDADAPDALEAAIGRALRLFARPDSYRAVQRAGMTRDLSWEPSAREYVAMFEDAIARRKSGSPQLADLLPRAIAEPGAPVLPPLPPVPESYARDVLVAIPRDPKTLMCAWESTRTDAVTYVLRFIEHHSRNQWDVTCGPFARNWFCDVEPEQTYEVELLVRAPGRPLERVLWTGPVTMPPALGPEGC